MTDELIAERDALKLKAADRDEWQQVAMKVSKERDALRAKLARRDYVPRAEVDAAWRKGMTDAAKIARDLVVDEAHNAPHNWITSDAIIDARDARKESAE